MKKIDAVSYTANPCLHTFYKRTPKYLFIILFLVAIIFGCTFYQRAVGQVEFERFEKHLSKKSFIISQKEYIKYCFNDKDECFDYSVKSLATGGIEVGKPNVKQSKESLEEMIIRKSKEANLDPAVALKIARCESSMNPLAESTKSSAKGLYQVISSTWRYCEGNPLNAEDSINCFIKLYPKHPNWWVCRG